MAACPSLNLLAENYKSLLFMRFVMYISSLVIYYRDRYMIGDYNLSRFIILNVKSYNAGMIKALSNRIGDVALLLSIAWILGYGSYIIYG
ncbi:NADH-ubiquinone oxidoreductase chain 5 [Gryllus bimaculatus]|nr:NADH-ubiquinone oxidoreductase chain 5 [Gryllus bimaculatus]